MYFFECQVKTRVTVLNSCLQLHKYSYIVKNTIFVCVFFLNTYSNRRVANHLHGLIFELKERMNSRQDRPVMHFNLFFLILQSILCNNNFKNEGETNIKWLQCLFLFCVMLYT
jgi:hypothetical protein